MSAQPSSTSTSTPIPGAALPSTTKPKRSKKKASKKDAPGPSVTEDASPVVPAPAQDEVAAVTSSAGNSGSKEKGPVEEVIAKRMRQLTKKLQRFREYASRPHDSLNADQIAGVKSLPNLESIYKELEDLSKQVEPVELEQAGKIRELKEQAKQEAESTVSQRVSEFQTSLSTPLALFLRLHQLLHPARSSDHEHLTFTRLDLPSNLQDEVQATDVLRVGRMHEDLIAGGERGSEVIAGLVRGATGEDEENDHVHHLLNLLSSSASDNTEPEEVDLQDSQQAAPEVEVPVSKAPSEDGVPNGDIPEEENTISSTAAEGTSAQGALNFLQEDELAEEEFEMVPRLSAEQTSGSQPPQEPVTTIPQPPIDSTPTPTVNGSSEPAPFNASTNFDWAADEDMDEAAEAAHIRQAFALPPSGAQTPALQSEPQGQVEEQTILTEEQEPAIALIQENELANAHVSETAVDVPTSVEGGAAIPAPPIVENQDIPVQGKPQRGGRGQGHHRNRSGRNAAGRNQGQNQNQITNQTQNQNQNRNQNHTQGQAQKVQGKPAVDEDGFQVVGRQLPPAANRGRGNVNPNGRGGGEAGRGRGGQGQNGRGRGGPGPRGPPRSASHAAPSGQAQNQVQGQEQGGNRPPRQPRQPSQASGQAKASTPTPTAA